MRDGRFVHLRKNAFPRRDRDARIVNVKGYQREKTWDPVTRVWHWILAAAVIAGWCFGEFLSFSTIQWHFYCGYVVIGLLLFRILWGFVGPNPVRIRALFFTPKQIVDYLKTLGRRAPSGTAGHNPLGSLSVIAMILLLMTQATSGLFIESDDFFEYGPLAHLVSEATVSRLTWWHHTFAKLILIVVGLHVLAILYYLIWKKENLIIPMVTGMKWVKFKSDQGGCNEASHRCPHCAN